ncbi:SlyX family protein [Bradyrhizobium uaiense]|uniref:SlyX family protein n=1 Tax=Bradyrhizobium uaiense TaxID=2594946 RepID=A0A6P1BAA3_9BRAD|nr:SlyX family protein [Bradyrhizobium uaiense]NEU95213.1 SlyX family protein [Bradyrhizobium uaiense]
MTNDSDQAWHSHAPSSLPPAARRRWPWFLLIVIILALAGAGGVYAWPQIAPLVPSLGNAAAGEKAAAAGDKEARPDLIATQQKLEDDIGALNKSVADQQAQVRTLVDQLAALTSKVDALQRPAPVPAPATAAAEQPHAPVAPAAAKPKKPPARAAKPAGPISTGGAPLNVAPSDH